MLEIYKYQENNKIEIIFFDDNMKVVVLPTKYMRYISKVPRYSPKSINQYAKILKYFCDFLEKRYLNISVDDIICSIGSIVIGEYLVHLSNSGLEASTVRNRDVIIKGFMEWLTTKDGGNVREDSGYLNGRYKSPNPVKKLPKYLTVYEIIAFIKNLHDESQRCIVHFLFDSGLRISELIRVKKSDIPNLDDSPDNSMYFSLEVRGSKGAGGNIKTRKTYISRSMIQRINRLHNQNKAYRRAKLKYGPDMPCFLNVHGEELTIGAIQNLLHKAAKRANLDPSKYTSHKYRHSFAISVLISEFDADFINKLVIVKEALGHNHIKTTQIYTSIAPAEIKRLQEMNKINEIFNRYEESQKVYEETYLPQKKHKEKRGRNKSARNKS
ncbi:tyrosine-type recombinase/integrase [Priestia sp. YIM B13448]|uniref:tyrosine-type recombinase/integrase n=1 Tax=Priestia sp. YIM B13448 TaxID=3366308 RepID=UPI003671910D